MHLDTLEGINLLVHSSKTATSVWHNRFSSFFFFTGIRSSQSSFEDETWSVLVWDIKRGLCERHMSFQSRGAHKRLLYGVQKRGMPPLDRRLESSYVLIVWPDLVLKLTQKAKTSLKWHHRYICTLTRALTDIYSHFSVFHLKEILISGQACGIQSYLVWILHYKSSAGWNI